LKRGGTEEAEEEINFGQFSNFGNPACFLRVSVVRFCFRGILAGGRNKKAKVAINLMLQKSFTTADFYGSTG
jgi:hypothetical protein